MPSSGAFRHRPLPQDKFTWPISGVRRRTRSWINALNALQFQPEALPRHLQREHRIADHQPHAAELPTCNTQGEHTGPETHKDTSLALSAVIMRKMVAVALRDGLPVFPFFFYFKLMSAFHQYEEHTCPGSTE